MKHSHGLAIPTTLKDVCDPQRMALLVYDMQVGICSQIKSGSEIVARISRLLAVARATRMRVAFTRHLSLPKAWMGATQFRTAMAWQGKDEPDSVAPWFLRDAPGFQIVSELTPMPDEAVFDKITMSAFEGTPLTLALRDCGILSVAIVDILTATRTSRGHRAASAHAVRSTQSPIGTIKPVSSASEMNSDGRISPRCG